MSDLLSDFERASWFNRTSSEKHPPAMACKAAVDQIARGELPNIKHAVVVLVQDVDGDDLIHVLQAGSLSELAIEGALLRAIRIQTEG